MFRNIHQDEAPLMHVREAIVPCGVDAGVDVAPAEAVLGFPFEGRQMNQPVLAALIGGVHVHLWTLWVALTVHTLLLHAGSGNMKWNITRSVSRCKNRSSPFFA